MPELLTVSHMIITSVHGPIMSISARDSQDVMVGYVLYWPPDMVTIAFLRRKNEDHKNESHNSERLMMQKWRCS